MRQDGASKVAFVTTLVLILASFVYFNFRARKEQRESGLQANVVHAVIELGSYTDTSRALIIGYNYDLLKQFASEGGINLDVQVSRRSRNGLDSLLRSAVDILVIPYEDSLVIDSALVSIPVDSNTVWVVRHDWKQELEQLNGWIAALYDNPDYDRRRNSYMKVYSPFRSGRRRSLSPYDSLIRHAADSIGWDWKMLAAVIYHESNFHIEAKSYRGARGLMQMMPSAAASFGVTDLLDPAQNIRAGASYLSMLGSRYSGIAENRLEKEKFALAAYNAGGGRIKDCIAFARAQGIDPHRWEDLAQVIPLMRDSANVAQVPEVRLGVFHGHETLSYVETVMAVYNEFCRIIQ